MDIDDEQQTWSLNADHVQDVLRFIRRRGAKGVTADELVTWDATHGKRLFCWDEAKAAHEWRVQQARVFLNSFRGVFNRMRVRKFQFVPGGEETGRADGAYLDTETISQDAKLREWAIGDLTRRLKSTASELRFWKLTEEERLTIMRQLDEALTEQLVGV